MEGHYTDSVDAFLIMDKRFELIIPIFCKEEPPFMFGTVDWLELLPLSLLLLL